MFSFLLSFFFFGSKEHKNDSLKVTGECMNFLCLYKVISSTLQVYVASWYIHLMFVKEIIFKYSFSPNVLRLIYWKIDAFFYKLNVMKINFLCDWGNFLKYSRLVWYFLQSFFLSCLSTIYGSSEALTVVSFQREQLDK